MALKTRITPLSRSIQIVVDGNLSPQARSQRIAAFAESRIAEADAQNASALGAAPPKTVSVDGHAGAPLTSVDPNHGVIVAEWRLVNDVVKWIMATLRQRSPVLSGRYRDSHTLYADGTECDADSPPPAQQYTVLNPLPYSRKIEIGKTKSGRDFVIQVPNRIYERTADEASSRFGNLAKIRFTYQSSVGGGKSADRVPAILITLR